MWLGGIAPLELKRIGRHGDGWLPSFCTPKQVAEARVTIEQIAAEHDRSIDPDHYGALIPYRIEGVAIPEATLTVIKTRNPDVDPAEIVPSKDGVEKVIQGFIDVGFSKFVLIPTIEPDDWDRELAELAGLVKPLEN